MRVLIVDDEPLARRGIAVRLKPYKEVEIVGECADGLSAVNQILELAPDLVFLDVQMPEMDGFEVLRALPRNRIPAVIFLTAFEQHALKAFEVHALDYLVKPVDDDRFSSAVNRASELIRSGQMTARLLKLLGEPSQYVSRFTVRSGSRIRVVSIDDVNWIAAAGDYVELHAGAKRHLLRQTMNSLEQKLDPAKFMRIHRSRIIRTASIRDLLSLENREFVVTLTDGSEHRTSRTYAERIEAWLAGT